MYKNSLLKINCHWATRKFVERLKNLMGNPIKIKILYYNNYWNLYLK